MVHHRDLQSWMRWWTKKIILMMMDGWSTILWDIHTHHHWDYLCQYGGSTLHPHENNRMIVHPIIQDCKSLVHQPLSPSLISLFFSLYLWLSISSLSTFIRSLSFWGWPRDHRQWGGLWGNSKWGRKFCGRGGESLSHWGEQHQQNTHTYTITHTHTHISLSIYIPFSFSFLAC